jgi:hypothetical protein
MEYVTGNKAMDKKIQEALAKEGVKTPLKTLIEREKRNKYGIAPKEDRTYKDGTIFASKNEMERWDYLVMMQKAKEISDLDRQIPFVLLEEFISKQKEWGEIQPMVYVADFVYTNLTFRKGYEGRKVVEDSKGGVRTPDYKLKRKLFLYKYAEYLFFEV